MWIIPFIQYADDILVVLPAEKDQIMVLKSLLDLYSVITGLKVNFHIFSIVPINLSEEEAASLCQDIGCQVVGMPFTYLGLPMGTTKPSIVDFAPLIDRVERRLNATTSFLYYGDILVLVNSVLSSLPTHYLCVLEIPKGVLDVIDRARKHCLWRKKQRKGSISCCMGHGL
jgi:hypothetical protein